MSRGPRVLSWAAWSRTRALCFIKSMSSPTCVVLLLLALHLRTASATKCGKETWNKPWIFGEQSWNIAGCTILSLKSGSVTAADMPALAMALKSTSGLETLDLSQNSIGDAGVMALASALTSHGTLKFLDLSYCSIGDTGAAALTEALKSNSKIRMLVLRGPPVSTAAQMALHAVVKLEPSSRPAHFRELRLRPDAEESSDVPNRSHERSTSAAVHEEV